MVHKILCFLVAGFMIAGCSSQESHAEKENAAVAAAEKWLEVIDAGEYGKARMEASELFRASVGSDQWEQSMREIHKPMGKLLSRKVKTQRYMDQLPGAPDGEYVIIEFDASYENKKETVETVTPMLEKSGEWRVSGYYIK